MAFTTRSKRDISALPATETGQNVGPGSYLSPSHYSAKPNLAPFCSSRDRGIAPPTARSGVNTPQAAPSSSEELALGAQNFSTGSFGGYSHPPRPSSSFAEGVSRFEDRRRSFTPGPGAYGQLSTRDWFKGIPRAQGEGRRRSVVFKRAVSAPSVPAKNQSFGYDEEESGELVMQVRGLGFVKSRLRNWLQSPLIAQRRRSQKRIRALGTTRILRGAGYTGERSWLCR